MEQEQPKINPNAKPILSSKIGNNLYVYEKRISENEFELLNLKTGKRGILNKDQFENKLQLPILLNEMTLKHQNLISLFKAFNGSVKVERNGEVMYFEV